MDYFNGNEFEISYFRTSTYVYKIYEKNIQKHNLNKD